MREGAGQAGAAPLLFTTDVPAVYLPLNRPIDSKAGVIWTRSTAPALNWGIAFRFGADRERRGSVHKSSCKSGSHHGYY
jgi:hypothetical protein